MLIVLLAKLVVTASSRVDCTAGEEPGYEASSERLRRESIPDNPGSSHLEATLFIAEVQCIW